MKKKSTRTDLAGLVGRDILMTEQLNLKEIELIINLAQKLKAFRDHHFTTRFFKDGIGFGCFQAGNNPNQEAFRFACHLTGLYPETSDISKIRNMGTDLGLFGGLAGMTELIAVDEDPKHTGIALICELIHFFDQGYLMKVISQRPSLINISSNLGWPLQALTELLFLKELFGSLKALKARKLTISWVFDPEHEVPEILPVSILRLLARFGLNITLAHPVGYELPPEAVSNVQKSAVKSKGKLKLTHRFKKSLRSADVVYLIPWRMPETRVNPDDGRMVTENALDQNMDDLEVSDNVGSLPEKWVLTPGKRSLAKDDQVVFLSWKDVLHKMDDISISQFIASEVHYLKRNQLKPFVLASMILAQKFANPNILLQEMINNDLSSTQGS